MKTKIVKDMMVSLSDYATVSEDSTLYDAIIALEEAQKKFDQTRYRHRAILIYDKNNHITGKVSQLDVLRALEPKDRLYKIADRNGMCVTVQPSGTVVFRFDYRLNGRRETLTLGRYDPTGV